MKKRSTIIDVAKVAGVSKSTVSLVLQKNPVVKSDTREKVTNVIKEIGYVYNRGAAGMRGSSAGLIGLVINDLRNPFYTELLVSTQMFFANRGYATVVANSNEDPGLQADLIGSMLEHSVDALLIAPAHGTGVEQFQRILDNRIPAMQVLRQVAGAPKGIPFFSMDYEAGGHLGVEHLIAQGCKRIAFVGGIEDAIVTLERRSGYIQKMKELNQRDLVFHGSSSRTFGYQTAQYISQKHPEIDGIVTFNDLVALGMMAGFAEANIIPGRDVRIVGFDDIEEASECYPSLSTVACDVGGFGRKAAGLLLRWLEGNEHPGHLPRIPVELIVRRTS